MGLGVGREVGISFSCFPFGHMCIFHVYFVVSLIYSTCFRMMEK